MMLRLLILLDEKNGANRRDIHGEPFRFEQPDFRPASRFA